MSNRKHHRQVDAIRPVEIARNINPHAEGSVRFAIGATELICTASVENKIPRFLRGQGKGWLTAEYSMLPRATTRRSEREAVRGKQSGRSMEIQRLIGRCLRQSIDLTRIGERTIIIDCDVIQADGGTRCAAITAGYIALQEAMRKLNLSDSFGAGLLTPVAAISVGIVADQIVLDLDYREDSDAVVDINVVMNARREYIEIQGGSERGSFSQDNLEQMLNLARQGCLNLFDLQQQSMVD